ncbi:MAG: flagellar assembly protein FliW [Moorellales bacterium]
MRVETERFGALEIEEQEILRFPFGLPGFEHLKEFFLLPVPRNPAFVWLQAVTEPAVAFLLADPFLFFPDYAVDLGESEVAALKAGGPEELSVYVVVTIPPEGVREMTANLLAPIVLNLRSRLGLQVILDGSGYTTRHRLFREAESSTKSGRAAAAD